MVFYIWNHYFEKENLFLSFTDWNVKFPDNSLTFWQNFIFPWHNMKFPDNSLTLKKFKIPWHFPDAYQSWLNTTVERSSMQEKESIRVVWFKLKSLSLEITIWHHLSSLVVQNSYPCDRIFNHHLTTMKDSNIFCILMKKKNIQINFRKKTFLSLLYTLIVPRSPRACFWWPSTWHAKLFSRKMPILCKNSSAKSSCSIDNRIFTSRL